MFLFSLSAAILGMHKLMSNQQYYDSLGSSNIVNKQGLNSEFFMDYRNHVYFVIQLFTL